MDARLSARIDASDVIQEAMIEASRRLPAFLAKNDAMFYPWLRAIAWERLIQLSRKHITAKKRSVQLEAPAGLRLPDASTTQLTRQLAASLSTPSAAAIRKELQHRVQTHLESLSAKDQEILLLRHLEQLSMKEIAATLDITLVAAQSRYFRALERMHHLVGEDPAL